MSRLTPVTAGCPARQIVGAVTLSCLLVLSGAALGAQGFTATLVGTVTDPSRASLAGATLVIVNEDTGLTRTLRTQTDGGFTITHLPPGPYRLTVDATGFRTFVATDVDLEADQVGRLDIQLEIGTFQQHVMVTADVPVLNTETSAKAEVMPNTLVQALPLNGRKYLDLALLVPGVYRRVGDDGGDGVATNGTRWDATAFALDGVLNRSDRTGNSGVAVPLDGVREFDVETSTYAAEYGRTAGAQINVVSKSGANRFSGTLSFYGRNDRFDARNYFAPPGEPSPLSRQQVGGAIGGPLRRDHTFFFAAYERTHQRESEFANSTAPDAAWLTGDFRNVRGAGPDGIWGNADDTNRLVNPFTRQEFQTPNVIPASMFDPIARQILPFIPAANLSGTPDGYAAQGLARDDQQQLLVRLDHRWRSATNISWRWARSWGGAVDPFPSQRVFYPDFGQNSDHDADSVVLSVTTPFGTRWINDARVGYFQQHVATVGGQSGTNYVGQFGLSGLSQDPSVWGFPTIRIDGFPDFGDRPNAPSTYDLRNLQFVDAITWTPDRHAIKLGVDLIQSAYREYDLRGIRGDFRFRGRGTNPANGASSGFRSFADFLLGLVDQTQRQVGTEPARLAGRQTAFFVQDDWRVKPSLTLNLGLRYERQSPLTEAADRLANFVPELGTVVLAGDSRFPRSLIRRDDDNVAPRVGFAWRPFDDARTAIRGGAGIYYSLEAFNVARQQMAVSYPFVLREQYKRTGNPASLTFAKPFPANLAAAQGVDAPMGMAVDYRTPTYYQYNLTIEREFGSDLAIEVGYVGSQGRHLGRRYDLNQPIPAGLAPDGTLVTVRPYPQFAEIQFQDQTVSSSYNALQASLRRRMAGGLTLLVSYTLGKSIDSGSNALGNLSNVSTTGAQKAPQDIYNMSAERGLSDFDRRHQFSAAFAYELPFGPGRRWASDSGSVGALVGGWQLSGIVTLLSGRPFTPQYSAGDFATERPNLVSDPMVDVPPGLWFNPSAFARPVATPDSPNVYGNAGRNILTGPGFQDVDLAITRTFGIGHGGNLQLRAEAFNVLNRPNFEVPVFLLDSSNVGRVTATSGDARQLQFAARLTF